jgi:RecA DNA recombination protein
MTGVTSVEGRECAIPKGALTQITPFPAIAQGLCLEERTYEKNEFWQRPFPEVQVTARGRSATALSHYSLAQLSGRTSFIVSMLAQATAREEFCALIDAGDCFDPLSAEQAGVDLTRVLWVRCREKRKLKPLEQAFKAADILIHNGGFGLIAVDLSWIEERNLRKVPLTTWFRFARVVEKLSTALVFLMSYPAAQSCAGMTMHMAGSAPCWTMAETIARDRVPNEGGRLGNQSSEHRPGTELLSEITFHAEVSRCRLRKRVQSARPQFSAKAVWG